MCVCISVPCSKIKVSSKYYDLGGEIRIITFFISNNYVPKIKLRNYIMVKFTGTALFKGMCQIKMRRWCKAEIHIRETDFINTFNNCALFSGVKEDLKCYSRVRNYQLDDNPLFTIIWCQ